MFSTFSLAIGPGTLSLSVDSLQLCPCSSKWGEQLWGECCVLCKWLTDSSSCLSRPRLYLHTPLSCSARCHSSMHFSLLLLLWWTQHNGVDSGYEWRQLLLPRSIFYDISTDTWVGYSWQCFTVTLFWVIILMCCNKAPTDKRKPLCVFVYQQKGGGSVSLSALALCQQTLIMDCSFERERGKKKHSLYFALLSQSFTTSNICIVLSEQLLSLSPELPKKTKSIVDCISVSIVHLLL